MTTVLACADCGHRDHHPIFDANRIYIGEPCFRKDPAQPDGFCRCRVYREARSAKEFADAMLGPDPNERHTWEGSDDRD